MPKEEAPLDLSYVLELAKPPTLEEELTMERDVLYVKEMEDIGELKKHTEHLVRQSHQQSLFIAGCLDLIHHLSAQIISLENPGMKPPKKGWLKKIVGL